MDENEQAWLEHLIIDDLSLGARVREVVPRTDEGEARAHPRSGRAAALTPRRAAGFSNEDVEVATDWCVAAMRNASLAAAHPPRTPPGAAALSSSIAS